MKRLLFIFLGLSINIQFSQAQDNRGSGNCLDFDGIDDRVDCGNNAILSITDAVTIEAWFKGNSTSSYNGIVAKSTIINEHNYLMQMCPTSAGAVSGTIMLHYNLDDRTGFSYFTPQRYDDNVYHHAAGIIDVANGICRIYIDGELVVDVTTATGALATSTNPLYIGARLDYGSPQTFDGNIDEVRVWNVARSQQDIRENMCKTLKGNEAGLVGYWKMNEGVDNTCTGGEDICDLSGNGNHGSFQ